MICSKQMDGVASPAANGVDVRNTASMAEASNPGAPLKVGSKIVNQKPPKQGLTK